MTMVSYNNGYPTVAIQGISNIEIENDVLPSQVMQDFLKEDLIEIERVMQLDMHGQELTLKELKRLRSGFLIKFAVPLFVSPDKLSFASEDVRYSYVYALTYADALNSAVGETVRGVREQLSNTLSSAKVA